MFYSAIVLSLIVGGALAYCSHSKCRRWLPPNGFMELKVNDVMPDMSKSGELEKRQRTEWKLIVMVGVIAFLSAVEGALIFISEWPYMHTIDPDATSQFFGVALVVHKLGHALSAVPFAFWSYRTHSTRMPLIAGRAVAFFSCCVYLCVELLPTGRRFLMLFCYFGLGIASGSMAIIRAYVAAVSTLEDRTRAYSSIVVAFMLSGIIAPVCQLALSTVPYPGYVLIEGFLKLHIYSAPVWISALLCLLSMIIIWFGLREVKSLKHNDSSEMFSLKGIKARLKTVRSLQISWSLVVLCWIERLMAGFPISTFVSVVSPLAMTSFEWNGQLTVKLLSVSMSISSVLTVSIAAALIFCRNKIRISSRLMFVIGLSVPIIMYTLTYPYKVFGRRVPPYNATEGVGCNPNEYTWCDHAYSTYPALFLPMMCLVMGIGVPSSHIALDAIYSKVLGNIDQSLMQGALVMVEDVVLILGPLYSSTMFTYFGQGTLWLVNAMITFAGILLWMCFFSKLKRYK